MIKFIKKIFHKIANWFKHLHLFYIEDVKLDDVAPTHKEEHTEEAETPEVENESISEEVENADPVDPMVDEEMVEEDAKNFYPIVENEKTSIANAIRPIIKALNYDSNYSIFFATSENKMRMLKTYVRLSEDSMSIDIFLTQNDDFNIMISNFIDKYVKEKFIDAIEEALGNKYEITSADGHIYVKKISE